MNTVLETLIAQAEQKAMEPGSHGHACVDNGTVQVYLIPVEQRTRIMKQHYRATFYVKSGNRWKRTTRAAAELEILTYMREAC